MRRAFPLLALIVTGFAGVLATLMVWQSERAASETRFEMIADEAADRLKNRIQQHFALLIATAAHVEADYLAAHAADAAPGVAAPEGRLVFAHYIGGLDLENTFSGIQGIGYSEIVAPGREGDVRQALLRQYGIERDLWPQSDAALRTAILILEPHNERNEAALGYDMYAEPRRREAMQRAIDNGKLAATAPLTLVQEITIDRQAGFLVYRPVHDEHGRTTGFVYAPFRAGDLHLAALLGRRGTFEVRTRDVAAADQAQEAILFETNGFEASAGGFEVERTLDVAGRPWALTIRPSSDVAFGGAGLFTLITGAISLMLALAAAAGFRWQQKAVFQAEALVEANARNLADKEMLLQEMKHRIKNSIARMLAMARQTAARSDSLDSFTRSFTARLQSMANAQDLLTRSRWERGDLRSLLETELAQIYGEDIANAALDGPPVDLASNRVQALGLAFHELATNALKYGAGATPQGKLAIAWSIRREAMVNVLRIEWRESGVSGLAPPEHRGFGSRLIDTTIRADLAGTIERHYEEGGLHVIIEMPIDDQERDPVNVRRR